MWCSIRWGMWCSIRWGSNLSLCIIRPQRSFVFSYSFRYASCSLLMELSNPQLSTALRDYMRLPELMKDATSSTVFSRSTCMHILHVTSTFTYMYMLKCCLSMHISTFTFKRNFFKLIHLKIIMTTLLVWKMMTVESIPRRFRG